MIIPVGTFWYKNIKRKPIMQGRVIIIDGASCSGKSSVIKQLMPMLDNSYEYVAVDDFVSEVFLEQRTRNLSEQEFMQKIIQQCDVMYSKIRELIANGKNVILDTVLSGLEGEKSVAETLKKLNVMNPVLILVHCPLPVLTKRIQNRNKQAAKDNKPDEERSAGTALSQFGYIFRPTASKNETTFSLVSRNDVETACEVAKKEWGNNVKKFEEFKTWLLSQLGAADNEVSLTTRLNYDYAVDTSKHTSQECAQAIRNKLYSKTIEINSQIHVYTEHFGNITNPVILLISGAMAPARFWIDSFCKQLSDSGYFVVRYDHRDMGLSSAVDYAKNPYTLHDLAHDAVAILDAYGIKKAHIVGHSMGGAIAQLMALDYPSRVLSITAISSSVLSNAELTPQEKASLEKTWQVMSRNKPTKIYPQSVDGFLKSFEYLHGTIPMDQEIAHAYIKDIYERTLPEHLEWFEKFSSGIEPLHNHVKAQQNIDDHMQDLTHIKIPTLVIHGQDDCLAFPRIAKEFCADLIPNAKMQIIPGMGHMILNRDLFMQIKDIVLDYIEKI